MRGFFEIIFGSGATGMPTLFLVSDWVSLHGVQISYNIIYGLSQIIPRSLWYSKPVDIDSIIQDEFGLVDNPSVFWYGDMYFSVGFIFLPIASLFLGLILTAAQKIIMKYQASGPIIAGGLIYANLFTLYKNGLGAYLAVSVTSIFLVLLVLCFFYFLSIVKSLLARHINENK